MIISVFIPHGGCPERCSFCDQKVSGGEPLSKNQVHENIVRHLQTNGAGVEPVSVAFYGGTFTALPQRLQLEYLSAVKPFLETGQVQGVRISTRPDAVDKQWLEKLKHEFKLETVELGVQSFETRALQAMGRTHSVESVYQARAVLAELGLQTGLHMMLGCPQESADADALLLQHLTALKPDFVRIHPLLVLQGTAVANAYNAGLFEPLALEPAVERASSLTMALEQQGIAVRRLGLQPNELLETAVIAGAYHPAFGELVRARMVRNRLAEVLDVQGVLPDSNIQLFLAKNWESKVKGQRSQNLHWLKEKYLLSEVQVHPATKQETDVEIWFYDATGTSQRREIQFAQYIDRRGPSHRYAEGANHLDAHAWVPSSP